MRATFSGGGHIILHTGDADYPLAPAGARELLQSLRAALFQLEEVERERERAEQAARLRAEWLAGGAVEVVGGGLVRPPPDWGYLAPGAHLVAMGGICRFTRPVWCHFKDKVHLYLTTWDTACGRGGWWTAPVKGPNEGGAGPFCKRCLRSANETTP